MKADHKKLVIVDGGPLNHLYIILKIIINRDLQ